MCVGVFFFVGGEKYNNKQGDAGAEVGIVELVFDFCRVYTMS